MFSLNQFMASTLTVAAFLGSLSSHAAVKNASKAAVKSTAKIVGGENALVGEFPFIVSMRSRGGSHFCGGSLIAQNWVLTAAHCVQGTTKEIWIGLYDQRDSSSVEKIKPLKIIPHPKYNESTLDNDWALIQLETNSSFAPITLNQSEITITEEAPIDSITAGWGSNGSGFFPPNILQKVTVPLVSNKVCNSAEAYNGDVTENMICAGFKEGGKDACQGDSGGPLVVLNADQKPVLIGVVSWGIGCALANKYGVYSKVSNAVSWINETMANQTPPVSSGTIVSSPANP